MLSAGARYLFQARGGRQSPRLPSEILTLIFESVLALTNGDPQLGTITLIAASLVCRQWRLARDLLSVELWTAENVGTFHESQSNRRRVRSMSFLWCEGATEAQLSDCDDLDRTLAAHPGLQQLTLICIGSKDKSTVSSDIQPRPSTRQVFRTHPSLTDLTILKTFDVKMEAVLFLSSMPPGIRFLSFIQREWTRLLPTYSPPDVELYGLSLLQYPSEMAAWLLTRSGASLQCLTVDELRDLDQLVTRHPNLRSLRIFESSHPLFINIACISRLVHLERFQMWHIGDEAVFASLPASLNYLRFCSANTAKALLHFLSNAKGEALPNLRTVVWDYLPPYEERGALLELLKARCNVRGIELRAYPRLDQGSRPSYVCDPLKPCLP